MHEITSIEALIEASKGTVVELPPFAEGTEFYARLKRPSMLDMVKNGKIPNSLLVSAQNLFVSGPGKMNTYNEDMMKQLYEVMDIICESTFVEPTYQELKDNNIVLTDDQRLFIFNYSQNGIAALDSFRKQ